MAGPARRRVSWVATVVAVVLVVGWVPASPLGATPRAQTPSRWDPRIRAVAEKVAALRDLKFEHPVAVRFLSEAEFTKRQRAERSDLSKNDEKDLRRNQAQLRALGLIGPDVDLFDAGNDIRSGDVLAYYDPDTKRITVKGTGDLDVATRVTVAHELTHALQDQHFDLRKIQREGAKHHAESAVRAMVEGDAVRVEGLYRDQLSDADRQAAVDGANAQAGVAQADAAAQEIPSMLLALFEAPYALGPSLVQAADGGVQGGIDGLFEHPPTNDSAMLTPSTVVDQAKFAAKVPPPARSDDKVGKREVFGAFALYLTLASRLGLEEALRVADGWSGDSMVTLTDSGSTCVRARFVGRDAASTKAIGDALDQWAVGVQSAMVTRADRPGITFTACDRGTELPPSPYTGTQVLAYLAVRNQIYAGLVAQGGSSPAAKCTADGVVRDPSAAPLLEHPDEEPPADQVAALRSRVMSIAADCARSKTS